MPLSRREARKKLAQDKLDYELKLAIGARDLPRVQAAIAAGGNVNTANCNVQSLLSYACMMGGKEIVETLITAGANIDGKSNSFMQHTPIFMSIGNHSKDILEVLVTHGADLNVLDSEGNTPLMRATARTYREMIYTGIENEGIEMMNVLISAGVDVNTVTKPNGTALHCASKNNIKDSLEVLIRAGANVNLVDDYGDTPLHEAAANFYDEADIVMILLNNGANINVLNLNGETPLHRAAKFTKRGAIKALLMKGADISIKNNEGKTALDHVIEQNFYEKPQLLYIAAYAEKLLAMADNPSDIGRGIFCKPETPEEIDLVKKRIELALKASQLPDNHLPRALGL